ncbi:hypothetical protein PLESTB_000408700 [Pleodorina starrii]|uniref:Uncharacterized protein n=1 Tax=Pleodorina starrii TaxID=330485 RepID=A0A9W6BFR6_9CHLO|nr:hypothetical protein PLESTM_001505000 [Pleodorina starrii]GLC50691.1 hypothetical protein PLESTB_000408700 [Pleodorina starrii]GLC75303.1 hypothetical protein PLESTF_001620000 [Pleodorina starrii]
MAGRLEAELGSLAALPHLCLCGVLCSFCFAGGLGGCRAVGRDGNNGGGGSGGSAGDGAGGCGSCCGFGGMAGGGGGVIATAARDFRGAGMLGRDGGRGSPRLVIMGGTVCADKRLDAE